MRLPTFTHIAIATTLMIGACSAAPGAAGPPSPSERPSAAATSAPPSAASSRPAEATASVAASLQPSNTASGMAGHHHAAEVTIKDFSFQPNAVEVAAGQVVTWTNEDGEPHTVRSEDGSVSSPIVGATPFEWTARGEPGSQIAYVCSIHPGMKGSVTIR